MHAQISLQNPASILFGLHPTVELLDHMTVLYKTYKHNEILLSHKKEWNNAISAILMDLETIVSEVGKAKTNTIWCHLSMESKIWHKWTYLQDRNRLKYREYICCCHGDGKVGEGWIESLGLADWNYYI